MEKLQLTVALIITAAIALPMALAIIDFLNTSLNQKVKKMLGVALLCAGTFTGGFVASSLCANKLIEVYSSSAEEERVEIAERQKICVSALENATSNEDVFTQLATIKGQDNNGFGFSTAFVVYYGEYKAYRNSWRAFRVYTTRMNRVEKAGNGVKEIIKGPFGQGYDDSG
jgi:hypothetical protein